MLAALVRSPGARQYRSDFFECPSDVWIAIFWTVSCGFIVFLLARAVGALWRLRRDDYNRRAATLYIVGCILGIGICLARIAAIWVGVNLAGWVWFSDCAASLVFAMTAARAWRQKIRYLQQQPAEL
jgi:hypothetical protein